MMSITRTRGVALALVAALPGLMARADEVRIGDVILDDDATRYVIYYRYIPDVENPGARARVYESFDDVADALRRAKNNGWLVDFRRSYEESESGNEEISSLSRTPLRPAIPPIGGTAWGSKYTNARYQLYFGENGTYYVSDSPDYKLAGQEFGRWTQDGETIRLTSDDGYKRELLFEDDRITFATGRIPDLLVGDEKTLYKR